MGRDISPAVKGSSGNTLEKCSLIKECDQTRRTLSDYKGVLHELLKAVIPPERSVSQGEQTGIPGPALLLGAHEESVDESCLSQLRHITITS